MSGAGSEIFGESRAPDGSLVAENFARWFGDSKIVDPHTGAPLVLYHGTTRTFEAFDRRKARGWADNNILGFFFTRHPGTASGYAGEKPGANVVPAYLSLRNPYVHHVYEWQEMQSNSPRWTQERIREWKRDLVARGHDGIVDSIGVEFIAFRPEEVKSAIGNSGLFCPNSPDFADALAIEADVDSDWPRQRARG